MNISLFDYDLPKRLIAQYPPSRRGESRLMVLNRADESITHCMFSDIADYVEPGDALVVNNTKVFKARLWGQRASGARVEVFLVRRSESDTGEAWEALVSPSRRVKEGESIFFSEKATVELRTQIGDGRWIVSFKSPAVRQKIVAQYGHVPLPHYITREESPDDIRRYQTVFANNTKVGAVAAPTAGFHFSRALLKKLRECGTSVVQLTLHVGPGTFKPVKAEHIENHIVDPEFAELSERAAGQINEVRLLRGKTFAVGTTTVRTLESAKQCDRQIEPFAGLVNLYIRPGFRFKAVDHLITNFHLPKSSLLLLVSAFAGRDFILRAYREAIENHYRFYSYGDAMLIL